MKGKLLITTPLLLTIAATAQAQAPTEPKPETPTAPAPVIPIEPPLEQPKPEEPKPSDPNPEEPKPGNPKPEEPKPGEPKPDEPNTGEPKPTAPKPAPIDPDAIPVSDPENKPPSIDPNDKDRNLENPNVVLAPPPVSIIPTPGNPNQIASETPNGPAITPDQPPIVPPSDDIPLPPPGDGDVQTGREDPSSSASIDSEDLIYDGERGLILANKAVTFKYGELVVTSDRGLVDTNAHRAIMTGNLTVKARGRTFYGKTLVFDTETGEWRLSSLNTVFPPSVFPPGQVLEPIYLRDGVISGDGEDVKGQNFQVTSCDRGHYYIRSRKIEFYRTPEGDPSRIVLRRNAVHLFGKKIFPLPLYVINLIGTNVRRQPLQATFGQNTIDGYFVRSLYDMRATPKTTDSLLVDALQKRGLGLGFQRQYAIGGGLLYLYALSGQTGGREINARVDRTYKLTDLINTNIRFDSSQNTSLLQNVVSRSETQNGAFTFTRNGDRAQSNAIFSFNNAIFGTNESKTSAISFTHQQNFGNGFTLSTNSSLNRSQSSDALGNFNSGTDSATSDHIITLGRTGKAFDLFLNTELHDDLVNKRSYTLEKLPELTLQSNTERLPIPGVADVLPGSFTFGLGKFNEPSSQQRKGRADFFFTPQEKSYRLLGGGKSQSIFSASGNFEQAFYSDDSARYNYTYNLTSRSTAGPAQMQVNYSKQRTFGFTPFQFDFQTPGEYVDYTFSVNANEKVRFNLTGGRDIQNSFTRDLIARVQFAPSDRFYASFGTTYTLDDANRAADAGTRFGDIYANVRFARNRERFGGGQFAFGIRYSPNGQGLARANGSIDINLGKRTRFQALAGYDGFTKRFDFNQYRITQDLHCFNLYATYDGQRRELRFDLAIKAFPFADSRFGRNQFSEGFDPSVGDVQ